MHAARHGGSFLTHWGRINQTFVISVSGGVNEGISAEPQCLTHGSWWIHQRETSDLLRGLRVNFDSPSCLCWDVAPEAKAALGIWEAWHVGGNICTSRMSLSWNILVLCEYENEFISLFVLCRHCSWQRDMSVNQIFSDCCSCNITWQHNTLRKKQLSTLFRIQNLTDVWHRSQLKNPRTEFSINVPVTSRVTNPDTSPAHT